MNAALGNLAKRMKADRDAVVSNGSIDVDLTSDEKKIVLNRSGIFSSQQANTHTETHTRTHLSCLYVGGRTGKAKVLASALTPLTMVMNEHSIHMNNVATGTLDFRKKMMEWKQDRDRKDDEWRRKMVEKEDKDKRIMMYVRIDKMSYSDAYDKVYGMGP